MKLVTIIFLFIFTTTHSVASDNSTNGVWEKTKEVANDALDVSKQAGRKALDVSQNAYKSISSKTERPTADARFKEIWNDTVELLDDGLGVVKEHKKAPDSSFFSADKKSLRADFNEILDELIVLLDDPVIVEDRNQLNLLNIRIEETKAQISKYREKKVVAPQEHLVKTTRSGYDKKIQDAEQDILHYENNIEELHLQLLERFREIGLDLNLNQMNVFLARVDSENIIQMSAVFDELKRVTAQLMELTQGSGEELNTAKRYYGMHTILIEIVIYMQDTYVEQMDNEYLPKIEEITLQAKQLQNSTRQNIANEKDSGRKKVYQKSLEAQNLTIKVAHLHRENLERYREKVVEARQKAMDDLRLAQNTYDTAEVCADLINLLNTSQDSFETIMNLQVPEIIPFENLEMEKKFKELSREMRKES